MALAVLTIQPPNYFIQPVEAEGVESVFGLELRVNLSVELVLGHAEGGEQMVDVCDERFSSLCRVG